MYCFLVEFESNVPLNVSVFNSEIAFPQEGICPTKIKHLFVTVSLKSQSEKSRRNKHLRSSSACTSQTEFWAPDPLSPQVARSSVKMIVSAVLSVVLLSPYWTFDISAKSDASTSQGEANNSETTWRQGGRLSAQQSMLLKLFVAFSSTKVHFSEISKKTNECHMCYSCYFQKKLRVF